MKKMTIFGIPYETTKIPKVQNNEDRKIFVKKNR